MARYVNYFTSLDLLDFVYFSIHLHRGGDYCNFKESIQLHFVEIVHHNGKWNLHLELYKMKVHRRGVKLYVTISLLLATMYAFTIVLISQHAQYSLHVVCIHVL